MRVVATNAWRVGIPLLAGRHQNPMFFGVFGRRTRLHMSATLISQQHRICWDQWVDICLRWRCLVSPDLFCIGEPFPWSFSIRQSEDWYLPWEPLLFCGEERLVQGAMWVVHYAA